MATKKQTTKTASKAKKPAAKKTVKKAPASKAKAPAKKSKVKKVVAAKAPVKKAAAKPKKKAPAKSVKTTPAKKVSAAKKPSVKKVAKKTVSKAKRSSPAVKKAKRASVKKPASQTKASVNNAPQTEAINNFLKETIMPQQNFQFEQMAQEAANASRENVEAFMKSGAIFAKGFEAIMKTAASISQTAAEKQAQYAQEIMGSKTINEAAEAQNKIAQANFDEFMSGATKISEMSVKLLNDTAAPLNEQVTKSVQKAGKMAA